MKVVNLISGPRNVSTALMYAFAQRQDFEVLDEPFYAYFLKNAGKRVAHPGESRVLSSMETDLQKIVARINAMAKASNVFVKGMSHHLLVERPRFIRDWHNVFLIRKPESLITSFSRVIPNPTIDDIGYKSTLRLIRYLEELGKEFLLLETDELLRDPRWYLDHLCEQLGMAFTPEMLHWRPGGIPEDGLWAEYWYQAVHNSTGFEKRTGASYSVPDSLAKLLQESIAYYNQLQPYILKNESHAADL